MRRPLTQTKPLPPPSSISPLWMGLLLAVVTVIAYLPALRGGFIWDDDAYVTQNALLTAPDGLSRIWFSAHRQSQYFPLAFTSLRLERALWGLNPLGYHAVNVLLHAANALLLWQLLRRLAAPGAWLAAAIFALHPVQVESVAWITELKNVQSTFFYLLAVLAWVKFTGPAPRARWEFYWVALLCHALALLSKTTACTLPAAFLLVLWWRRQPLGWQRVLQVLPFLLLGLGMGLVSVWWENHLGNFAEPEAGGQYGFLEKGLIATRAVWFYAAKLFWPANLTFSYPRWEIDTRAPGQYLGLLGCGLVAGLLWWRRKDFGRGLTAGVIFFVAALSPLLGFIPLYTFCYSFVADHYQYLACTGLIIPFAALLSKQLMDEGRRRGLGCCLKGGLLLVLGVLTWKQTQIYADQKTLWQDTLSKNPASSMAHNNLGTVLAEQGLIDEAIPQFRQALRLSPDNVGAHDSLGIALGQQGHTDESIHQFEEAIRLKPGFADPHNNLGVALDKKGQIDEAILQYQEAIRLNPDNAEPHNNLGAAFGKKGRIEEAILQYQEAIRLEPDAAEAHYNLGTALSVTGQTEEAIRQYQEALRLKPDFAQARDGLARLLQTHPIPTAR